MTALYLQHQGSTVSLTNGMLRVTPPPVEGCPPTDQAPGTDPADVPLLALASVIVIGRIGFTTPALASLCSHGIPTSFVTVHGRYRGRLQPPAAESVTPRLTQYASLAQPEVQLALSRDIVQHKVEEGIRLLQQQARGGVIGLGDSMESMRRAVDGVTRATTLDQLRGHEGLAARAYWQAFIASLRVPHAMRQRATRPPPDDVNAALSFGYALLLGDVLAAVQLADLDPSIGVLHGLRHRRPALALDLMEPFRQPVVDRLVLRTLNRRELRPEHFESRAGGVFLNDEGRRTYLERYDDLLCSSDGLLPREEYGEDNWRQAIRRTALQFRDELRRRVPIPLGASLDDVPEEADEPDEPDADDPGEQPS